MQAADKQASSSLLDAARSGDSKAAAAFLVNDPDAITQTDEEGCTALHLASDSGSLEVLQLLLASGAAVNARDNEGQTALHYGAICEREEVRRCSAAHLASAHSAPHCQCCTAPILARSACRAECCVACVHIAFIIWDAAIRCGRH